MYIYKYILCILFIFSFNLYCITSVNISDSFYSITSVNDGITDINDVVFEDYSINLSTIDFPKLSTFLWFKVKFLYYQYF
ncbi:hypothetical protein [Brachyspira hyodysenteriae]|uniref:hypothetical protein n=1 Tax=Brachyspira hyodysenteriae TaxID=159 RepID=UPI000B16565B|nr:hypothetical protein [Brachyspira hyodysenteriae]